MTIITGLPAAGTLDGSEQVPVVQDGETRVAKLRTGSGAGFRAVKGVLVHIGDSNTNGRADWRVGYEIEWLKPGGIFEGWTSYNHGHNGSVLQSWATTEVTYADDPLYKDLPPQDFTVDPGWGKLARTINAKPDLIIICLGTNDLNSPLNRTTAGLEANLRINLAKLVNFLVKRTHAHILLRMPAPFVHEPFPSPGGDIVQWANQAEAREASRRLRVVYREWKGVHPRVEVYDSHAALFGDYCDDKTTQAQDPFGSGPLLADSLHPNGLGYRRQQQQIAHQLCGWFPHSPVIRVEPYTIPKDAVWATTLFCRTAPSAGTSVNLSFDFSPSNVVANTAGAQAATPGATNLQPVANKPLLELSAQIGKLSGFRELMAVPKKSKVFAYSHASGVTTELTGYSLSQLVTAQEPHYATLTLTAASTAGLGGGRVTFYVTDPSAIPYTSRSVMNTSLTTLEKGFSVPVLGQTIGGGTAVRKPANSAPVVTVYLQNAADGSFGATPSPGKVVGTFTWTAFQNRAAFVFDPTNYPLGAISITASNELLWARVTTGTIATELGGNVDMYFTT